VRVCGTVDVLGGQFHGDVFLLLTVAWMFLLYCVGSVVNEDKCTVDFIDDSLMQQLWSSV